MTWKDGFYDALLRFVREDLHKYGAEEVTSFEERMYEGGVYSDWTYDPPYTMVEITYREHDGKLRTAEWEGSFAELIGLREMLRWYREYLAHASVEEKIRLAGSGYEYISEYPLENVKGSIQWTRLRTSRTGPPNGYSPGTPARSTSSSSRREARISVPSAAWGSTAGSSGRTWSAAPVTCSPSGTAGGSSPAVPQWTRSGSLRVTAGTRTSSGIT